MDAPQVILIIIGLQVVAIAFLLVATMVVHSRRSGTEIVKLRRLWNRSCSPALDGEPSATARIRASLDSKIALEAFHGFIDERLRGQRGRSPLALRRLSRATGFTDWLQNRMTRARDPLDRAAAAKTLARLREGVAQETALELLESADPAVVLAAAYATASFKDPEQFLPVFRAIYARTPITLHGAAELLSGFEDGVCPVIHRLLMNVAGQYHRPSSAGSSEEIDPRVAVDRSDTAALVVMIDLLAFYSYVPAALTLTRLLRLSDNDEVIIHLVKTIAKVGDVGAVPRLIQLLSHPNWVIRSQSAGALAALETAGVVPAMEALLEDAGPRVRARIQRAPQARTAVAGLAKVSA